MFRAVHNLLSMLICSRKKVTRAKLRFLFYSGAKACVKLNLLEDAIIWCHKGLAVSFDFFTGTV